MRTFLDGIDSVLDAADGVVSGIERVVGGPRRPRARGGDPSDPSDPREGRPAQSPASSAGRGRPPVEEVVDAQTGQTDYVVRTADGTVSCSSPNLARRVRDSLG